jgi:hypothetical protein
MTSPSATAALTALLAATTLGLADPDTCAVVDAERPSVGVLSVSRGGSGPACPDCVVQLQLIADAAFTTAFGPDTTDIIRDAIARADEIMSAPQTAGGLDLHLVESDGYQYFGLNPWPESTNALTLLTTFADWAETDFPVPRDRGDALILFTGLSLDGGAVGLSFQSSVCSDQAVGVVSYLTDNTEFNASILVHMLGHILGASHDGIGNTCDFTGHIMSPGVSEVNIPTTFSDCSIEEINARIAAGADCLTLAPCNVADIAPPIGSLDFSDVVAFLAAFSAMEPHADLALPLGTFDFSDVSRFLSAYGAGCP